MKLRELNEDRVRDEEILARAKNDFINTLVTNLGTVVDSSYASQEISSQSTAPETPEQKRIRLQRANIQTARASMTPKAAPAVTPESKFKAPKINGLQPRNMSENKKFEKLNKIFESLLNVDEAVNSPSESASTLIISDFIKQMNAPHIFNVNNPAILNKLNEFANEIEQTYAQDRGRTAIKHLAEWAWDTMTEFKQSRKSTRLGTGSVIQPTQVSTTSEPSINADGSITISGAKGQATGKILPGDPLYNQLAAAINNQIVKNK